MTFTEKLEEAAEKWCESFSEPGDFEELGQQEAWYAGVNFAFQLAIDQLNSLEATEDLVGVIKTPADAARWLEQWREKS